MSNKVFTYKEYQNLKTEIKKDKKPAEVKPTPAQSFNYFLMYPDNVVDRYYNGNYVCNSENLEIKNGVIITKNIDTCEMLKKQGFIYMYELPSEL